MDLNHITYITRTDPTTGLMTPHEPKRKVFISYKHSDEERLPLCQKLASYILAQLDVAIWYDRQLTAGQKYDSDIENAISQADCFVLLLTPEILSSDYVINHEIPMAIKNHISIIPIIAGISRDEIQKVEEIVGRIHMPRWFYDIQEVAPEFQKEYLNQFLGGLQMSIANKDLLEQAKLFYSRGSDKISIRYLTPEQMFIKAYGYLFGVDSTTDKIQGVKLMESIVNMYDVDDEFAQLQIQVDSELLNHLYRTNNPNLLISCLKASISKNYPHAINMLFTIYQHNWHPEIFKNETGLSFDMVSHQYKKNFGHDFDPRDIISKTYYKTVISEDAAPCNHPHIGELCFDDHYVYLQKSSNTVDEVNMVLDGKIIDVYDICRKTDPTFVYLGYDIKNDLLITLYSDFDHYGPESIVTCNLFEFSDGEIRKYTVISDWVRGIRPLPYSYFSFEK